MRFGPGCHVELMISVIKKTTIPRQTDARHNPNTTFLRIGAKLLGCRNAAMCISQESPDNEAVQTVLAHEVDCLLHISEIGARTIEVWLSKRWSGPVLRELMI